ncbi:MAG: hypothetical protein HY720_25150 [Planctomycetes bacterium]|nr:hypothetical protein [Planctomycetota bacterium]
MLEIIFLYCFGKKLSEIAQVKGRSGLWAALGILFWIGGEIAGAMAAAIAGVSGVGVYGAALVCAITGAVLAWVIVSQLPDVHPIRRVRFSRGTV